MIRPVIGIVFVACLSAAAYANETESLPFHCGKTFITFNRTHFFNGKEAQEANSLLTVRKADVDHVNLWLAAGTTHLHIGMKGKEGRPTFVPKSFHREIVECLD